MEKLGVSISIGSDEHDINISFKCLTKDLRSVISLLAEELRFPRFDPKEFELLRQQNINGIKRGLEDPGKQAQIALAQAIYPKGHPNYKTDIETSIKAMEAVTLDDLKAFHKTYFGPAGMHLVAVGDVDNNSLYTALNTAFNDWSGGVTNMGKYESPAKGEAMTHVVTIPRKPSAVQD